MDKQRTVTMYQMCLLHSRADRALRVVVARQLDEFDITMMQWLLLATVCGGPNSGMSMTELARALDVTLPQVTALTSDLVKMKAVRQKVSNADRRSRHLVCTSTGKKLIERIETAVNQSVGQWLGDIPENQFAAYLEVVRRLSAINDTDS